MEIILCILTGALGGIAGYFAGRLAGFAAQRTAVRSEQADIPDAQLLQQYKNFMNYDGTGKGQKDLEN